MMGHVSAYRIIENYSGGIILRCSFNDGDAGARENKNIAVKMGDSASAKVSNRKEGSNIIKLLL